MASFQPQTLSVVIPAFNEEKLLPSTLASLRAALPALEERGWKCEIIVCDNNSTDRTAQAAREGGAQVVFEERNQIARARNRGASAAQGEWLLFLDADSQVSYRLFEALGQAIARPEVLGGGCCIDLPPGSRLRLRLIAELWNTLSRLTRWTAGSFIFCRQEIFRTIRFCEEVYAGEDALFGRAMKKAARRHGMTTVILSRTRLVTSDRKFHLYSGQEHLRILARFCFRPFRSMRDPGSCRFWYDGRR